MGTESNKRMRCAKALLVALALAGSPVQAQDAPPSDAEMASAAPGADAAPAPASHGAPPEVQPSDGNSKEVYGKHVERVKRIKSLFDKLKTQVESMEQVQQVAVATPAPDLPPEALQTEDDPAPADDATSVLDETPGKGKKPRTPKADSAPRELAAAAGGSTGTYTVQKGDTLGKIAAKLLGTSKKAPVIAKANGMTVTESLKVGRELIIPGAGMAASANLGDVAVGTAKSEKAAKIKKKATRGPKNPSSEPVLDYSNYDFKMYVVKPGDSLSKIAKAFYESGNGAELIRKYNKLGGSAAKEAPLKAGEKILIPLPKQKATDERYEKAKKGIF
jgi:LysM repeat protein